MADFGLSECMYEEQYFRQVRDDNLKLPIKWMALESMENATFTEKTDVVLQSIHHALFHMTMIFKLPSLACSGHLE